MVPQPGREALQPVLPEAHSRDGVGVVRSRDDEGEDEEDEEEDDEHEHADEVEAKEAFLLPIGAEEAGEGDGEESESDEDEGPAEPADALVVGLGREPYAGGNDGDGAHEGDEVEYGRDVVAHCSHGCVTETYYNGLGYRYK